MTTGSRRRVAIAGSLVLIGFLVGVTISVRSDLFSRSEAISLFSGNAAPSTPSTAAPPGVTIPDFVALSQQISPSVVNISSTQEMKSPFAGGGGPGGGPGGGQGGGEEDPFHEFFGPFEKFFGQPRRP